LIPVRVKILWLLLGRPPLSRRVNLLPKIRIGERVGAHQVPPTDWEAVIVITTTPRKLFVWRVSSSYCYETGGLGYRKETQITVNSSVFIS
jgi:hypothetical protein